MERVRLNYTPEWAGSIEGYVMNQIHRNLWRMRGKYDFEDMYQEAYICFDFCCNKYSLVTEPAHFMALYKKALFHWFYDMMARARKIPVAISRIPMTESIDDDFDLLTLREDTFDTEETLDLFLKVQDAPALLIPIFQYLCDVEEISLILSPKDFADRPAVKKRTPTKSIRKYKRVLKDDDYFWEIIRRYVCKAKGEDHLSPKSFQIPKEVRRRISIKQQIERWCNGETVQGPKGNLY